MKRAASLLALVVLTACSAQQGVATSPPTTTSVIASGMSSSPPAGATPSTIASRATSTPGRSATSAVPTRTPTATQSSPAPTKPTPTRASSTRTTSTRPTSARPTPTRPTSTTARPTSATIRWDPIPYPESRLTQMADYARRHYGVHTATITPKVIVLHFTESDTWSSVWNLFASNAPNRGEYPGTCAQFVIDKSGVVHQLTPATRMCRHTVGLNHVAIGIEFVQATHGNSSSWADRQILERDAQVEAGLALVRRLQSTYDIPDANVIGHASADDSRYFVEHLGWVNTHTDWQPADVARFVARLH